MNGLQEQQDGARYCFVYRSARYDRIQAGIDLALFPSILAFLIWTNGNGVEFSWELLFFVIVLVLVFLRNFFPGHTLQIDSEGITLRWRWSLPRTKRLRWPEIAQVRWREVRRLAGECHALQLFNHEGWRLHTLEVIHSGMPLYAGEGHDLSLPEAISQFRPLMVADKMADKAADKVMWDAIRKDFGGGSTLISGGETAHIAYAAVALWLLLALLAPFHHTRALETAGQHIFYQTLYWAAGLGGALVALSYAWRRGERWEAVMRTSIPALLFGGACGFLMVPLLHGAPAWLGEARSEPFVIVREDGNRQHWQGVESPELAFTLPLAPDERVYRMPGKPRFFTIYRGPFGLAVMERHEYRALSRFGEK
jgi:hypothetical protein